VRSSDPTAVVFVHRYVVHPADDLGQAGCVDSSRGKIEIEGWVFLCNTHASRVDPLFRRRRTVIRPPLNSSERMTEAAEKFGRAALRLTWTLSYMPPEMATGGSVVAVLPVIYELYSTQDEQELEMLLPLSKRCLRQALRTMQEDRLCISCAAPYLRCFLNRSEIRTLTRVSSDCKCDR
jgi:hypothetical protein